MARFCRDLSFVGLVALAACGRSEVGLGGGADPGGTAGTGGHLAGGGSGGRGDSAGGSGAGSGGSGAGSGGGSAGTAEAGSGAAPPSGGSAGTGMAGAESGGTGGRPIDVELEVPVPRLPENGDATGSVWVEGARRPRFAWQAVAGTTTELEVDDSCEVGDVQDCSFPSPEWVARDVPGTERVPEQALPVNEQAPVGRRYYWRLRACTKDACSRWSPVRYVDVARQKNDFDGDGYADLVLENEGNIATRGRVLVGFGPLPSSRTVVLQDADRDEIQDHFGAVAVPLGDLDADGFADLLVTAPGDFQVSMGKGLVYFGSELFSAVEGHIVLTVSGNGDVPGDAFGSVAVPAGDVDADGFQDFVIGTSALDAPISRLCRGSRRSVIASDLFPVLEDEASVALSAGDVSGDGYSDLLAVNVRGGPDDAALHYFLRGGPSGFGMAELLEQRDGYPFAPRTIFSDLNRDGFRDLGLAIGGPGDLAEHHVEVSLGAEPPSLETNVSWRAGLTPGSDGETYADLSAPIAAGDVNGDGFDDALLGIGWHLSTRVQANLYLGGRGDRSEPEAVYTTTTTSGLKFVSTGVPQAAGDVNGDGYDDVFLKDADSHQGALFLGGIGLDMTPDDELSLPLQ